MRRSPLARKAPLRRVGRGRGVQVRAYRLLRVGFLEANPLCVFPGGCGLRATDVHHRRGRVGGLLVATEYWSALCRSHHLWVTEHPAAAYASGVSERRVGGGS